MRPGFLADHNLDDMIVTGVLRDEPTAQFVRAREVGLQEATDQVVLEYAARHSLIVVTHDVNTMIKHANARVSLGQPLPGLFIARYRHSVTRIVDDLLLIWSTSEAEEWRDRVFWLPM